MENKKQIKTMSCTLCLKCMIWTCIASIGALACRCFCVGRSGGRTHNTEVSTPNRCKAKSLASKTRERNAQMFTRL